MRNPVHNNRDWLRKLDESAPSMAISVFSIKLTDCSRVLREWIFVPSSTAGARFAALHRWRRFRCEAALSWSHSARCLGQILQIEELKELQLEQAEARYHLSPGLVTIDELILRSPNVRLTASGTVTFDGRLKLDSQLAINERIRGQLFKPIRANFQPISEAGYSAIDFHVGGTIDRPSTNLMNQLVGRDLSGMINS